MRAGLTIRNVQFPHNLFVGVQLDDLVAVAAGDEQMTVRERHDFSAGEMITLAPDAARAHLFDAESGKSLMQG